MLTAHVERYTALRQALGFALRRTVRRLRAFAEFAEAMGDTHVRAAAAVDWASQAASPGERHIRLRDVAGLARFLHAEDVAHEVPPLVFRAPRHRCPPYIYTPEQLAQIVAAASHLRETYPLRRRTYATLLGLIAATGLRLSEALNLRLGDVLPDGVLRIQRTKFGKSRLVPLHPITQAAFANYLDDRRQLATVDDHVFLSAGGRRISVSTADYTFRRVLWLAEIATTGARACRIHDLRHTFATRALQRCSTRRETVARHFVALATYMGHSEIAHTYWYLEATPELMANIAAAGEALLAGEGV